MADLHFNNRYCIHFFNNRDCPNGNKCSYIHKAKNEVEKLHYVVGSEFFLGKLLNQRVCRYFRRGHCIHQQNCNYLHDNCESTAGRSNMDRLPRNALLYAIPKHPSTSQTADSVNRNTMNNWKETPNKQLEFGCGGICVRGHSSHQQNCNYLHDNCESTAGRSNMDKLPPNALVSGIASYPSTSQTADIVNKNTMYNWKETPNKLLEIVFDETCVHKNVGGATSNPEGAAAEGACSSAMANFRDSWVNAPEFIPKSRLQTRSYAEVLGAENSNHAATACYSEKTNIPQLCPYANKDGICRNMVHCSYVHGEKCDMCERLILHPYNEDQRKRHRQECLKEHEKNMELSFAIARSKEKTCGVCFEVIMEKATGEQRFGILPNCNHCFCLTCIRKWRQARQFENKIIRACPECRVTSDFVCPSMYWVDTKEDKDKLIEDYKSALSRKDCKYFKKGQGKCPFGNKCFYLHALPDGQKLDVGPPPRQRRPRNPENDMDVLQVMLWDFLDERDFPWQSLADDLEDLVSFFSDSDDSDWSDYELFFD